MSLISSTPASAFKTYTAPPYADRTGFKTGVNEGLASRVARMVFLNSTPNKVTVWTFHSLAKRLNQKNLTELAQILKGEFNCAKDDQIKDLINVRMGQPGGTTISHHQVLNICKLQQKNVDAEALNDLLWNVNFKQPLDQPVKTDPNWYPVGYESSEQENINHAKGDYLTEGVILQEIDNYRNGRKWHVPLMHVINKKLGRDLDTDIQYPDLENHFRENGKSKPNFAQWINCMTLRSEETPVTVQCLEQALDTRWGMLKTYLRISNSSEQRLVSVEELKAAGLPHSHLNVFNCNLKRKLDQPLTEEDRTNPAIPIRFLINYDLQRDLDAMVGLGEFVAYFPNRRSLISEWINCEYLQPLSSTLDCRQIENCLPGENLKHALNALLKRSREHPITVGELQEQKLPHSHLNALNCNLGRKLDLPLTEEDRKNPKLLVHFLINYDLQRDPNTDVTLPEFIGYFEKNMGKRPLLSEWINCEYLQPLSSPVGYKGLPNPQTLSGALSLLLNRPSNDMITAQDLREQKLPHGFFDVANCNLRLPLDTPPHNAKIKLSEILKRQPTFAEFANFGLGLSLGTDSDLRKSFLKDYSQFQQAMNGFLDRPLETEITAEDCKEVGPSFAALAKSTK